MGKSGCPLRPKSIAKEPCQKQVLVGPARFELATSPLSGVRSNQLSYEPESKIIPLLCNHRHKNWSCLDRWAHLGSMCQNPPMVGRLIALYNKYRLQKLKKQGLQIAEDCRLITFPDFGSEPYLVSIGKHVTVSGFVSFVTHDGGSFVFRDQEPYKNVRRVGRITIHDNCFIGIRSVILPGVEIGPNSVVGAGSVVTKTVPPNTVVAGVPAKPIMTVEEYAERMKAKYDGHDQEAWEKDAKAYFLSRFPYPWPFENS